MSVRPDDDDNAAADAPEDRSATDVILPNGKAICRIVSKIRGGLNILGLVCKTF